MRISIVTDTYAPQVNGVATTLRRLVRGLRERGHRIDVIRPAELPCEEAGMKVPSVPLPRYPEIRVGLPVRQAIQRRWNRDRPDAVYVASAFPLGISAIGAAKALGIPAASGFHTNFQQYAAHYQLGLLERSAMKYLRRLHNRSDCTFVPTNEGIDQLRRAGFRNLRLLPRGVDSKRFSPEKRDPILRKEWGLPSDTGLAGIYVGRLAAEKNLPAVVRTFEAMRSRFPGFRGIFVGDGPRRAELKRKHPEFRFPGARFGEDLARHYASADLFVFPSLTETFGNVILEAMASGLGVVAYDYAAARQHLANGVNGYAVSMNSEDAFVRTAVAAATDSRLPEIRVAARDSASEVGWNSVIDGFENSLCDLVAQPNSRRAIVEGAAFDRPGAGAILGAV